ncbi:cilia- and flagella-associated protein 45-like isoform X2 [Heptranchias perlo]|uniref:cilia- and flagella-associated protein 45-like isoform X1 n=1 Tax=Heptranchias perlo TaxID=212740 RepID=UPI00355A8024
MSFCPGGCAPRLDPNGSAGPYPSRRYRTKALSSNIDETLFGIRRQKLAGPTQPEANFDPCSDKLLGELLSVPSGTQKPIESVRLITKDLVRDLM